MSESLPRPLLSEKRRVPPEATKTVTTIPFEVPEGTRALTLAFDYGPRECTDRAVNLPLVEAAFDKHIARRKADLDADQLAEHRRRLGVDTRAGSLNNLLNVVLIDPNGQWRGRWDRRPPEHAGDLVLGESAASRGFLPGAITSGTWTAAIECHGVFGEPVDYQLDILARGEPTASEIEAVREPAPTMPAFVDRGRDWYFGELHSHSTHSDGAHELADIADRAARSGHDFLALTDHNTMSAHPPTSPMPVVIVRGFELTTFHGHHPIYGLSDMIPWHRDGKVLGLAELAPSIRAAGGIVGVAHPFVPGDPLCTGCRMIDDLPPESFDTIEIWYRRWTSPGSDNRAAYELWNRLWTEGHRPIAVGARDWHRKEQEGPFPGDMPLTGILADDSSPESILAGLRAGRVIISRGPILHLELWRDGMCVAGVGDTVDTDEQGSVTMRIWYSRLVGDAELRLFRSSKLIETLAVDRDDAFTRPLPGPGYYRAELWQDGEPLVITNHLEVT